MKLCEDQLIRVVLLGKETCGIIHDLAEEFVQRGYKTTTVAQDNPYFDYEYDFRLLPFPQRHWPGALSKFVNTNVRRVTKRIPALHPMAFSRAFTRCCGDVDLYIQVNAGWAGEERLLRTLNGKGTRIATLFMGSEIRDYKLFQEQYGEEDWEFPPVYGGRSTAEMVRIIRAHERHSHAIFSVPDQMQLATRPYHHLHVPIHIENCVYQVPRRELPLIVHVPSSPALKGTRVVHEVLEQLKTEGVAFDLLSVSGIPHKAVLQLLTVADVLVDELLLHGPGWLSFEAMASGCAVATRYLKDSPPCFCPPVWNVDRRNIYSQLKRLLTDRALRCELAEKGRRYVKENNTVAKVADNILERTLDPQAVPDYEPTFFNAELAQRLKVCSLPERKCL